MNATEFRACLEQLGVSQVRAARMLGIDQRTARRWAKDVPVDPSAERLLFLAMGLALSADDIFQLIRRGRWRVRLAGRRQVS